MGLDGDKLFWDMLDALTSCVALGEAKLPVSDSVWNLEAKGIVTVKAASEAGSATSERRGCCNEPEV
jgi:hypothetical protein